MISRALALTLALCVLLPLSSPSVVSLSNLQTFFNSTYDLDSNGHSTLQQFTHYYQVMQPQANITQADVKQTFQLFDCNSDGRVTLRQLVQIARVKIGYRTGHKQVHIGFTSSHDEMQVMWVSNPEHYNKPVVHFGDLPTRLNKKAYAVEKTYNVGHIGFHGRIYKAVLTGLQSNKRYYYKVGDEETLTFSEVKFFRSPPPASTELSEVNFAVFGDMGTFAPFGHMVINQIARDNFVKPYDFVFLTGDIAYAGIGSEKKGEIEPIWDLLGELTQSFAAYTPFMPGMGNHEKYYDYAAYTARYELPRQYPGEPNFWYSFDYGQVHIAYFSSQHPYGKGSQQYAFLENDLRNARANPHTKWIIVGCHRPFYSSNQREFSNETQLSRDLEQLLNYYKVDIVQNGHIHSYQRSWPVYKNKPQKQGHTETLFTNPSHPIYVVQATAGALLYEKWVEPAPDYAIRRMLMYGYGRITVAGNKLRYQFIRAPTGKVVDQWVIVKE